MIKVGDVIKLRPSIFDKEFQKYNWTNKYLYEDQFEFVSLRFRTLGQPGDMAKTIFGSSETIIDEIENDSDENPFIVLTSNFRIIYPEALRNNEIIVSPFVESDFKTFHSEKALIDDLEFFEQEYLGGLFSVMERENNKLDKYKLGLFMMIREGKWKNIR
jgi:hypothetical protein